MLYSSTRFLGHNSETPTSTHALWRPKRSHWRVFSTEELPIRFGSDARFCYIDACYNIGVARFDRNMADGSSLTVNTHSAAVCNIFWFITYLAMGLFIGWSLHLSILSFVLGEVWSSSSAGLHDIYLIVALFYTIRVTWPTRLCVRRISRCWSQLLCEEHLKRGVITKKSWRYFLLWHESNITFWLYLAESPTQSVHTVRHGRCDDFEQCPKIDRTKFECPL